MENNSLGCIFIREHCFTYICDIWDALPQLVNWQHQEIKCILIGIIYNGKLIELFLLSWIKHAFSDWLLHIYMKEISPIQLMLTMTCFYNMFIAFRPPKSRVLTFNWWIKKDIRHTRKLKFNELVHGQ